METHLHASLILKNFRGYKKGGKRDKERRERREREWMGKEEERLDFGLLSLCKPAAAPYYLMKLPNT
jgi:hypothetical protein